MLYYAYDKAGNRLPGYTDPQYKGSYGPIIEYAIMRCGEGGHVEDEDGNTVWTWDDWRKEDEQQTAGLPEKRGEMEKVKAIDNLGYQCGQLLKLADVIGQRYGNYDITIPGNQTYEQISRYPRRGLKNLLGRTDHYVQTAKRAGDEAAVLWDKLFGEMATIDDSYRWNNEEKALLFVGYMAALPL